MVTLKDVFGQLVRDVRTEKLRTFLTVFGIVWGTVAISLMLAFGTGLHKQLIKSTAGLGDRIVIAWPGLTSIPYEGLGKGRRIRIADEDNPTGYFEFEAVKQIENDSSWLADARGRAVKMISALLKHLPAGYLEQPPLPFPARSASELKHIRQGLHEILTLLSARPH